MHGLGSTRRNIVERLDEALVLIREKTLIGFLRDQRIPEEFVITKQVLCGFLIVVRGPVARVILEVTFVGVGKIGCAGVNVVVYGSKIFVGGELVIQVLIVVIVVLIIIAVVL